ncbi:MAG: chemotaxis-specific protein-glutamate methyltransferase CheB [bacterium]|nr:chemotaxis-specific protein-glutamate methyltransferase CheB [bacterium]
MSQESGQRIRVAVVDDSTFIRKAILRMLADDPLLEVVGSAGSGEELLTHLDAWRPDVITLDLDMPGMGGLATLDRIMARRPTPVIILSTHSGKGAPLTIEALHRGATDFIDKQQYSLVDFEALRSVLIERIFQVTDKALPTQAESPDNDASHEIEAAAGLPEPVPGAYDLIVIGASTGGPPTLQKILEDLGESISVPVVVVQHMPVGFTFAFAERLNAYLPLQVGEAHTQERLLPDTVYIAPAGSHLRIRRHEDELIAETSAFPKDLVHVPSIDVLFESAAEAVGRRAIGALLTGMGRDGAKGMVALQYRGGYTLCQDEASCVVFGMPRAALALGAVTEIAAPDFMGKRIKQLIESGVRGPGKHPSVR